MCWHQIYLILLILALHGTRSRATQLKVFRTLSGFRSTGTVLDATQTRSQSACALACAINNGCLGFSYNNLEPGGDCQLLSNPTGDTAADGWIRGVLENAGKAYFEFDVLNVNLRHQKPAKRQGTNL